MKILLIQPNPRACHGRVVCAAAPLGLLYLASALRAAGYGQVAVIDARLHDLGHDELSDRIREYSPDLVGLTALGVEAPELPALARLAKQAAPGCRVVAGGPHASSCPEETAENPDTDFVVIGEGERTVCELAAVLEKGGEPQSVAGLVFKKDGRSVRTAPRAAIEDLDSIPLPAWDLAELPKRFRARGRHSVTPFPLSPEIVPVFTSRGCPYGCVYCHNLFGKRARLRSAADVAGEIELLVRNYGVREIEFVDDIFNYDLARAKAVCDEIEARGLKIRLSFPNGLRVDRMDGELVLKLRRAGAYLLVYAVESGSPEVQRRIGKNLDLARAREIIRLTIRQNILVGGFFMLGFPGETREEMRATVAFAWEFPFYQAYFFYVTPWPGTPLHRQALQADPRLGAAKLRDHLNLSVNLSAVPDAELEDIMNGACKGYYRRPRLLWLLAALVPLRLALNIALRAVMPREWAYRNLP